MNSKKILSLVMAIAMAMSLLTTAMATDSGDTVSAKSGDSLTHEARYTGDTTVPTIDLALSAVNTALAFNPYKLAVKVDTDGVPKSNGSNTADDQLITKEITITNLTNVPLKMKGSLTVTTSLGAGAPSDAQKAEVTNKAIAATETAKKLYVYADFYAYDDTYAKVPELTKTAAAAQRLVAPASGTAATHTDANRVVLQATPGKQQDATNDKPNYVYVKVSGEATNAPTEAWESYDKVQIDLVFSFQSQPNYAKYAVVDKNNTSGFEVHPVYSKENVKVAKNSTANAPDLCEGVDKKVVGGAVCYIIPDSGKKITAVKFYEKSGTTAITTVKATSTNSKDPFAPYSFTMPQDNVVMEVTVS
jgi:hypothetical protein